MAHIDPLPIESLGELAGPLKALEPMFGSIPNSLLTMARRPAVLSAYLKLGEAAMLSGEIDTRLRRLVALVASTAAGCRYCQAHMTLFSAVLGASPEEVADVWRFELDDGFTPAERAVLRLARDAGIVPNAVTSEHFKELRAYYPDGQIAELVAVIAMFGFLNRCNDTLATDLETPPSAAAHRVLGDLGWEPGKHSGSG